MKTWGTPGAQRDDEPIHVSTSRRAGNDGGVFSAGGGSGTDRRGPGAELAVPAASGLEL